MRLLIFSDAGVLIIFYFIFIFIQRDLMMSNPAVVPVVLWLAALSLFIFLGQFCISFLNINIDRLKNVFTGKVIRALFFAIMLFFADIIRYNLKLFIIIYIFALFLTGNFYLSLRKNKRSEMETVKKEGE
ncbi:hypothetical protein WKV44_01680 [Spirochaetia bacterium 38H-sp]|uniref:Uncharacterized protein n=1 Tax=Rarispira pelagica TaxID=3141764 RepID=A0ABU9U9B3_9SPIR